MRSISERSESGPSTFGRAAARRRRRRLRWLWGGAAIVVLAIGLLTADFLLYGDRIHPGVEVTGAEVGGLTLEQATEVLDAEARRLLDRRIAFRWPDGRVSATPRALGWDPRVAATAARAAGVGHGGPFWSDAWVRIRARFRPVQIPWEATWDRSVLAGTVERWNERAGEAPREGRVRVRGTSVTPVQPAPGRRIEPAEVARLVSSALHGDAEEPLPLPLVPLDPVTTREDVSRAEEEIRSLLEGPVRARLGRLDVEIAPSELGSLLRTVVDPENGLVIRLVPRRVAELLEPYREEAETPPRSARFVVQGDRVRIERSVPGRALDARAAAEDLLRIARSSERTGRIRLARRRPSFTTGDARALGIRREVASFTTHHAAGEPRVQNIHRAADILEGAIVEPGETFSLNERLGERTAERGFVSAPVIYDGEFTMDVGGGVSQLATTTFNAAFFAGYPFLQYQAHSYYISRYPMGREATVSWPQPDLVFRNDTSTGALIATEYTASSITVRIFGQRHGRRVTATDPVVTGRSSSGFSVRVERIVREGGREVRRDTFTTFYRG